MANRMFWIKKVADPCLIVTHWLHNPEIAGSIPPLHVTYKLVLRMRRKIEVQCTRCYTLSTKIPSVTSGKGCLLYLAQSPVTN
ncbi:hypothetical protein DPMN_061543 [Dreissena polymorpha]|uniref:Uncharacterized protein n=1 Tax=Dreissena polymorpha TaxID=45954 RepID=A0A9D4C778_DREPO|nr:hypothetical protein DPMN_061452 [Dreissena polymorpha]KAH3718737.1 hypothetical protein DPMN_061543 [Dreissena polymorpha]